ncbi:hypothetical protein LCGC14_0842520 [marine sediment metagenome]|uniref:Uncharacterized protein n=1 Tax=marine sediment metagenome TaxID=412755 RepID=A0A0F9PHE6_9ZZZZ
MNNTEIRKGIKTAMGMSQEQLNYAAAKALFDTHDAIKVEESEQSEYEKKYWQLLDIKLKTEKELIGWAKNLLKSRSPAQYESVKQCFERPIYNLALRQQLIDLCFRVQAS